MKYVPIIACVAAILVGLVHVRREEIVTRHAIQRLRIRQIKLRRVLWDQQRRLGRLRCPGRVLRRATALAPETDREDRLRGRLMAEHAPRRPLTRQPSPAGRPVVARP